MGKSNRPLVIRLKPGESIEQATTRALANPKASKRNTGKILVRTVSK